MFLCKTRMAATKQRWAMARRWCLGAALAMGLGCAAAQDLISERAYFEDSSGKMELAQVIDAPFQSAQIWWTGTFSYQLNWSWKYEKLLCIELRLKLSS